MQRALFPELLPEFEFEVESPPPPSLGIFVVDKLAKERNKGKRKEIREQARQQRGVFEKG